MSNNLSAFFAGRFFSLLSYIDMVKRSKLKYLTPLQVDLFKQQGYLSPFHLLSTEACSDLKKKIECFERKRSHDVIWAFDIKANLLFDWIYKLGAQQQILDIVEDLLGPNIFNTNTVFRIKEPGSSTSYGWHQDAARIDVRPFLSLPVWLSANQHRKMADCACFRDRIALFCLSTWWKTKTARQNARSHGRSAWSRIMLLICNSRLGRLPFSAAGLCTDQGLICADTVGLRY